MSAIEWTDETWNPVTGCKKVSPGCANCYAEGIAKRFWGDRKFTDVRFHADRLSQPLKWRKPRMVFVNSMSDLFHESVTDEQLDRIFAVMALTPHHIYQVLTKRPERMMQYLGESLRRYASIADAAYKLGASADWRCKVPLPNVWLGVTVENQATADERIPLLLKTPASIRFLSCEPLLEEVDLTYAFALIDSNGEPFAPRCKDDGSNMIDWVIAGGESGPAARRCDVAWIRSIVEQCAEFDVPCFVKQLGHRPEESWINEAGERQGHLVEVSGKGNIPDEWPSDLRVRQFPVGAPGLL